MCALTESELGSFETLELATQFVNELDFSEFKTETDIYIHDSAECIDYIICCAGDDIIFVVDRHGLCKPESYIYCHASDYDDQYVWF
jgi:hypothetical protein